jgi:hypothetical protein
MVGFIIALVTMSLSYNQYSTIADLQHLEFTTTHALGFSVLTRSPGNGIKTVSR